MEDERMRAPERLRDDDDHKPHGAWEPGKPPETSGSQADRWQAHKQIVLRGVYRLQRATATAVSVLQAVMLDCRAPTSTRARAAQTILDISLRLDREARLLFKALDWDSPYNQSQDLIELVQAQRRRLAAMKEASARARSDPLVLSKNDPGSL